MHRAWGVLVVVGALAALPVAAPAAGPQHERFSDSLTDPDFCGSGKTVVGTFEVRANVWLLEDAEGEFSKVTERGQFTLTSPDTGRQLFYSFSGQTRNTILEGDPEGVHTHHYSSRGLQAQIRTKGEGVDVRDAGVLDQIITFDGNGDVLDYEATWKGPHPLLSEDAEDFCSLATRQLGLL